MTGGIVTIRDWSRSIAALGALTAALLVACPVLAVDGVIEINQARAVAGNVTAGDGPGFPVVISASGSYRLTGNLNPTSGQDGIDVTTNHVTIDLNGFTITGGGGGVTDGISIQGATNVDVKNGSILGFTRNGIFSGGTTNYIRVSGITTIGNGVFGIDLEGVGGVIDGCTTIDSNTGMRVVDGSRVVNSVTRGNTSFGLVLSGASGYGSNVISGNNGGNINPQVSGGFQLGTNICGAGTTCP
jgi:hypothetical protein